MTVKNRQFFVPLLCAALAAAMLFSGCAGGSAPPASSGQPARSGEGGDAAAGTASALGSLKSFTAGTLDGGSFTQDDIAAVDVTVVNFWSLTCGPCVAEMPDLAAFSKALPENVRLVTVCLDGAGSEDLVREVLEEAGFEDVTLISGDGDLAALCGNLMYTPTTVFADAEGGLVGDAVIGRQEDLPGTFLAAVNTVLAAGGKAEISLVE